MIDAPTPTPHPRTIQQVLDDAARAVRDAWLRELPDAARASLAAHGDLVEAISRDAVRVQIEAIAAGAGNVRQTAELRDAVDHLAAQLAHLRVVARADARTAMMATLSRTAQAADAVASWLIRRLLAGGGV